MALRELDLPEAPAPVGAYERGIVHGGLGFLSGQFPLKDGKLVHVGRIGAELTEAQGCDAAEIAALNALAGIRALLDGDFADLVTLLKIDGYVASAAGFIRQHRVLDGASETFRRLLGDRGRHARTAFAVPRLPLDAPIELVVTFGVAAERAPKTG